MSKFNEILFLKKGKFSEIKIAKKTNDYQVREYFAMKYVSELENYNAEKEVKIFF